MKMYCISHEMDTAVGLRLTGIETVVAEEKQEIESEIDKVLEDETIGILIVTETIYKMSEAKLEEIRANRKLPLIVAL